MLETEAVTLPERLGPKATVPTMHAASNVPENRSGVRDRARRTTLRKAHPQRSLPNPKETPYATISPKLS